MIDQELLDILVCPVSKGKLEYLADSNELACTESGLAYPIDEGIPVMLETAARKLDQ